MKKILLISILIFPVVALSASADSSKPAREPKVGQGCECPYDIDKRGRSCGKRSAYNKPSGRSPICYTSDADKLKPKK